jgi:hypothetical protein
MGRLKKATAATTTASLAWTIHCSMPGFPTIKTGPIKASAMHIQMPYQLNMDLI